MVIWLSRQIACHDTLLFQAVGISGALLYTVSLAALLYLNKVYIRVAFY